MTDPEALLSLPAFQAIDTDSTRFRIAVVAAHLLNMSDSAAVLRVSTRKLAKATGYSQTNCVHHLHWLEAQKLIAVRKEGEGRTCKMFYDTTALKEQIKAKQ